jgi:septum formation protein
MQARQIILASGSPRRKDLLTLMGVDFKVIPSEFYEQLDDSRSPEEVAKELGLGKAMTVAKRYPDAIVIGSDTVVSVDGKQLGKPTDEADARAMHQLLAGRCNVISTSLAVVCLNEDFEEVDVINSKVFFKPYDSDAVETYLESGDWEDKAAGYGVQSGADIFVDYAEGEYDNILGFPTKRLTEILAELGVKAHPAVTTPPAGLRFK